MKSSTTSGEIALLDGAGAIAGRKSEPLRPERCHLEGQCTGLLVFDQGTVQRTFKFAGDCHGPLVGSPLLCQ